MKKLNEIELALLTKLSNKYDLLSNHVPFLRVTNRKKTGVGMYIKFDYSKIDKVLKEVEPRNAAISTNELIEVSNLKYGLCWEVDITEGRVNYIEIVSNGEEWDGTFPDFHLKELSFDL
jgi:hypothetical protein